MRTSRENCAFNRRLPGPMIMLREALPNVPGRRDARTPSVLKNRSIVGSAS